MIPPYVWTSDFASGITNGNNLIIVQWAATEIAFTDQWNATSSQAMTWASPTNLYRYRCMWTNELR